MSGPYSPHGPGNNRYTPGHGGRGVIDVWTEHIQSQPDMVIFTTWNDLGKHHCVMRAVSLPLCLSASLPLFLTLCVPGEHHYVGPYNLQHYGYQRYNAFPHLAYLELSSYFIQWYKLPAGSPAPPITTEQLFYFYNLQPANNSCPGDPVGPGRFVLDDPEFPLEDRL